MITTYIILYAVGVAFITASIPPLVSSLAYGELRGTALGFMETIKDIGQALGPISMGYLSRTMNYNQAFTIIATSLLLIIVLNIIVHKRIT